MTWEIKVGDVRAVLPTLPDESVHCVVMSPPYWGLRDYGTAAWEGGDATCDHVARYPEEIAAANRLGPSGYLPPTNAAFQSRASQFRETCGKCGARRIDSQLGLEPTPEEYVATMVDVFKDVRRVLRKDGTAWINLGDSYAASTRGAGGEGKQHSNHGSVLSDRRWVIAGGLKPKDLCGIPWRLAFALQADGWWLRSDIVWAKPNPMPESVTDRPTKAHEYVFLMTKRERYYYDGEAVREKARYGFSAETGQSSFDRLGGNRIANTVTPGNGGSRNLRTVWTIATHPFPEAHFATFPPKLAERCIKAGTSERGCCPECGAPWKRVVEREGGASYSTGKSEAKRAQGLATAFSGYPPGVDPPTFRTVGWHPACSHGAEPEPCVVLDPFAGAGTTGLVATRLSRSFVGIELNPKYAAMARRRIESDAPLFSGEPQTPEDAKQTIIDNQLDLAIGGYE